MDNQEKIDINHHKDKALFQAAVRYTAAQTGFRAELIEKDYFCSVILAYLYSFKDFLPVFKGGTLLAKIYGDFYRLSEDLDFTLSSNPLDSQSHRRDQIKAVKSIFNACDTALTGIQIKHPLEGANRSRQYNGELVYDSLISSQKGRIRIEINLHETMIEKPQIEQAKTLLLNPFTAMPLVSQFKVTCFSKMETYAEKIRAAFCRSEPAIRDYFDIDYALRYGELDLENEDLIAMIQQKIQVQSHQFNELDQNRIQALQLQMETELLPTLRSQDYQQFQLENVVSRLQKLSQDCFAVDVV